MAWLPSTHYICQAPPATAANLGIWNCRDAALPGTSGRKQPNTQQQCSVHAEPEHSGGVSHRIPKPAGSRARKLRPRPWSKPGILRAPAFASLSPCQTRRLGSAIWNDAGRAIVGPVFRVFRHTQDKQTPARQYLSSGACTISPTSTSLGNQIPPNHQSTYRPQKLTHTIEPHPNHPRSPHPQQ